MNRYFLKEMWHFNLQIQSYRARLEKAVHDIETQHHQINEKLERLDKMITRLNQEVRLIASHIV